MSATTDGAGPQADAEAQKRKAIMAIMLDPTLTEAEKARKRQALMMGSWAVKAVEDSGKPDAAPGKAEAANGSAGSSAPALPAAAAAPALDENLKCAICMDLCERPVTAPCQHSFCLACFKKWTYQGKKTCPTCRAGFPSKFSQNPRINTSLIVAIRLAKNPVKASGPSKEYKRVDNEQRPDEAFTTERAQRNGRANAASGRIMVSIPNDFFGPIEAQHDPERSRGVLVGDWWKDRLDCRQWGAHFPHVAGIAGQSEVGAQSVVLSGGYEDDRDEGEWFLYTGSGGRDLSGNKRTNKEQSSDQEFTKMNKALRLSCEKGLPVRVVRSFKERRSNYAPSEETPVRYDGIYRILRCWRKPGMQGKLVCRYLFMRCDNSPAPWNAEEEGDHVRLEVPEEADKEMKEAKGTVYAMKEGPYWDWLPDEGKWGWAKPAPVSNRLPGGKAPSAKKQARARVSEHEKALKEFKCHLCKDTLNQPIRTPCGHNFCKGCLDKKFPDGDIVAPNASRALRIRKVVKPCPCCKADICDFLSTAQVNREMSEIITKLQTAVAAAKEEAAKEEAEAPGDEEEDDDEAAEGEGEGTGEEEAASGGAGPSTSGKKSATKKAIKRGRSAKSKGSDEEGEEEAQQEEDGSSAGEEKAGKRHAGTKRTSKPAAAAAPSEPQQPASAAEGVAVPAAMEVDGAKPPQEQARVAGGQGQGQPAEGVCCVVAVGMGGGGASADKPAGDASALVAAAAPQQQAEPPFRYAVELKTLLAEFSEADPELVKCFLEDQAGDLKDVRFQLRKLKQEVKPRKKVAASSKEDATGTKAVSEEGGAAGSTGGTGASPVGTKKGRGHVAAGAGTASKRRGGGKNKVQEAQEETAVDEAVAPLAGDPKEAQKELPAAMVPA